jgi:hypothetical protein
MEADVNVQVEEQLATVRAIVARQQHCLDEFVVETISDLLQHGAD